MRILGITAEYNPFHNGHKYHLKQSVKEAKADFTVAVMSGNFTQRGEAASMDKWERSRIAVENGVDLVLELPFVFACSRAENFASGAVDILEGIGVTDISFGSESGDLQELEFFAKELETYRDDIESLRRIKMKEGNSFVKSLQMAVEHVLGKGMSELINVPNNILAIEYIRRINHWADKGRNIRPHAIKRFGSGYRDADKSAGFAGASVLRKLASEDDVNNDELLRYMPENSVRAFLAANKGGGVPERMFLLLKGEILQNDSESLSKIHFMGEGLENKFRKEIVKARSLDELISSIVSRRYTEAAVRRLIVYTLMGIRQSELPHDVYARVLAAGEKGRKLLKLIKKEELAHIPVITNVNKQEDACMLVEETIKYDMRASDIYNVLRGRDLYRYSDKVVTPYIAK